MPASSGKRKGVFTPWESATGVIAASQPGLLPVGSCLPLTVLLFLVMGLWLYPVMGLASLPVALLFGRLMALDLTTYTLPNIYTVPLMAVGWVYALLHGQGGAALAAVIVLLVFGWFLGKLPARMGLGGGDLKLLAAMFAFLPPFAAFCALAAGCMAWLPVAFAKPRQPVPFGVPALIGWLVVLRLPPLEWLTLPKQLLSPIS